jgi:hypothetical protein
VACLSGGRACWKRSPLPNGELPFFAYHNGWVKASLLEPGDRLLGHDLQWIAVEDLLDTGEYEAVYNLRIADYHIYFVITLQNRSTRVQ